MANQGPDDAASVSSKLRKYQVRLEIRSSNQEILEIMRSDIESIVHFFGHGEFLLGQ